MNDYTPVSSYSPRRSIVSLNKSSMPPSILKPLWDKALIRILLHAILGLIFGILIDRSIGKIKTDRAEKTAHFSWLRIILQLILIIAFIATVEGFTPWISNDWQDTNAGMFFAAIFFSVQTRFFEDFKTAIPAF